MFFGSALRLVVNKVLKGMKTVYSSTQQEKNRAEGVQKGEV